MMSAITTKFLLAGSVRLPAQVAVTRNFWTTTVASEPTKSSTSTKIPEPPKRPLTPYMRFAVPKMETMDGPMPGKAKELGRQWREMTEEAKRPFITQYETEKQKYQKTVDDFMMKLEKAGKMELFKAQEDMTRSAATIRRLKTAINKLEEEMDKPKGIPRSPWSLFVVEESKGVKLGDKGVGQMTQALSEKWKVMSNEEKMVYQDKLKAMTTEWEKKMKAWEKKNMNTEKMTELENAISKLKLAKSKKRIANNVLKESSN